MSWETVVSKRRRNKPNKVKAHSQTENGVKRFLETYKTKPCERIDFHDHRLCHGYHDGTNDRRRNPYLEYYSPDESLNKIETMYHPAVFRTEFCRRHQDCTFGSVCSRAHCPEEIRDRSTVQLDYDQNAPRQSALRVGPSLEAFLPGTTEKPNYHVDARAAWKEMRFKPKTRFIEIPPHLYFAVARSSKLFQSIEESVFEECLGIVTLTSHDSRQGLQVTGIDLDGMEVRIHSLLQEPSPHFRSTTHDFGGRVKKQLQSILNRGTLSSSDIHFQIRNGTVRMTAIHGKRYNADEILQRTIEKLEFWIQQEKYDVLYECGCCMEKFNADEGVLCRNGHFFCSVVGEMDSCFASLVSSQILELATREDHSVVCSTCQDPYDDRTVVSNLPSGAWNDLHKAIVDAEVAKRADLLNSEFHERVQLAVREALSAYGNADAELRLEAKRLAKEARDTILNLSCPHCGVAYFDFTGCMALKCQVCSMSFCGYCHQKTQTSRGAHEHVRQCLMNETPDASYYATREQIHDAQRRYRTREIKRFIRNHKKSLQNAIVIELEQDLKDLDIKQEALLELGNLMVEEQDQD